MTLLRGWASRHPLPFARSLKLNPTHTLGPWNKQTASSRARHTCVHLLRSLGYLRRLLSTMMLKNLAGVLKESCKGLLGNNLARQSITSRSIRSQSCRVILTFILKCAFFEKLNFRNKKPLSVRHKVASSEECLECVLEQSLEKIPHCSEGWLSWTACKAGHRKASYPHFPRFAVRIFRIYCVKGEQMRIFCTFAWSGPNCKMRKVRPTGLILTGNRCNGCQDHFSTAELVASRVLVLTDSASLTWSQYQKALLIDEEITFPWWET